jgi:hypothetical protein
MLIRQLAEHINARVTSPVAGVDAAIDRVYAGDRVSDMLNQTSERTMVVTNLVGASLLRVAELADIPAICLLNGREPEPPIRQGAERKGIALLVSPFDMFETCGRLHAALRGGHAG